jgi:glyceraldehyde 3-phosphate dehydrogenase
MTDRVAINGFGRIGRNYLRSALQRGMLGEEITVVAVNDLWDTPTLAHLLARDSAFGPLPEAVRHETDSLIVAGHHIAVTAERDPANLPWAEHGVDLVIEATGRLRTREAAAAHLAAGASRVLISAPGKGEVDATLVVGVNDTLYDPQRDFIVSAASCTTNCLAPMAKVLDEAFGIQQGYLTTVHAYTNDQSLIDSPHKDLRRARSAAVNIIPASTGAAKAVGLVLPSLQGKLDGVALRVPVEDGSITDLTCHLSVPATVAEVNEAFRSAADQSLKDILTYSEAPLVSRDIIGDPASCVFDSGLTQANGYLVKVFGWYDNEWGYINRLVDLTEMFARRR